MIKKYIFAIVLISFFLSACGPATFQVLEDTSKNGGKYAKTEKYAGVMNQAMFDYFMRIGRSSIVEDKELKESKKKMLLKELDDLQFKKNQFLYFTMVYNMPFLDDELKLQFEVLDEKQQNSVIGNTLVYQKLYKYGALVSVNYSYVVHCNDSIGPVIKNGSANFKVKFPDGASSTYKVKL